MCNGCELTTEEKQRIKDKSTDFYQRYRLEQILAQQKQLLAMNRLNEKIHQGRNT